MRFDSPPAAQHDELRALPMEIGWRNGRGPGWTEPGWGVGRCLLVEIAGVHDTIQTLPHGYRTLLRRIFPTDETGERGVTLSGGEWQRVALARAFLREDADVLILDEPSSGLDAQLEHALHQRLRRLRARKLTLLISHRLNALRDADRIIVLEDGRIAEAGTHNQLLEQSGHYAQLFTLQARGYQESQSGHTDEHPEIAQTHP